MNWFKQMLSEEGFASSTRVVKILMVLIFAFDWVWTRVYEKQPKFEPNIEILTFIIMILGLSLAQKYLEKRK